MTTSTQGSSASPDFSAISSWTQSDYNLLTSTIILSMTDIQLQAMLHPEWVPVSVFTDLPAATLNKFSATQFQTLTPDQLNQIPTKTLPGVNVDHIAALTAAQVAGFTHITALSPAQFGQLNLTAVAATTMSSWSQAVWSGLTAAQVSLMSLPQINSFQHASWLPLAAASGLLPAQVSTLSGNYGQFTAAWLNQLRPETLQALNASRLNTITAATWAQLDDTRLAALTAAQVGWLNNLGLLSSAQFGLLNISALSATQIAALSDTQYTGITAAQIATLTPAQVSAMTAPGSLSSTATSAITAVQLAAVTVDFSAFSDNWLNSLSVSAVEGMTLSQIGQLTAAQIAGLDSAHSSALTYARGLSEMPVATISNWTRADYDLLTPRLMNTLSAAQIQAMAHPEWIPVSAVASLTAAQVAGVSPDLSSVSPDWLNALAITALQALSTAQVSSLSAGAVAGLDSSHLSALTPAQFGQLNLTAVAATTMSSWSQAVWSGLTAAQVSEMSLPQINSFQRANWLPLAAASGLLPTQASTLSGNYGQFTAAWLNQLRPETLQALNASRLNTITAATWAQLDDTRLAALTADQVGWLNNLGLLSSAQFGLLNISALSATQIAALSDTQYTGITAAQIATLTPAQVSAMTSPGSLSAAATAALTAAQTSAFTADISDVPAGWLNSLSIPAFLGLSATLMGEISPAVVGSLDAAHQDALGTKIPYNILTARDIAAMTPAQIQALAHPEWIPLVAVAAMTADQVAAISADTSVLPVAWLDSLTPDALKGLTLTQVAHLTAGQVAGMTSLANFSADQFGQLNLTALSSAAIGSWGSNEYAGLTAQQIGSLSTVQIHAMQHPDLMTATAAAGFSPAQVASINISMSWFSADWLNTLSVDAFTALSTTQLNQISGTRLSSVDNAHLSALSAAQVSTMTNLGSLASGKFSVLNISALSTDQLAAMTRSQYQGLTNAQMSSMSATQREGLVHPEWFSPGLINTISVAQFASLTSEQIADLTPGAISCLDAAHLAVYPGDLNILSNDTLMSVASRLTDVQRSALNPAAKALLSANDSAASTLISSLSDDGLKNIMQSVQSSAGTLFSISAIESVMQALNSGMGDTLSTAEYAGLQSYTNSIGQVCGKESSTYSLMDGMVNGANNASVEWANADGTFTRINHLNVGSSSTEVSLHTANWLSGTNAPLLSSTSNTDGRPLYANGTPTINDIHQGTYGDCSLLSALQAVVDADPNFIKSMIVQNSNNTYSVRFFNNGVPAWVTLDNNVASKGANREDSSWVSIVERANVAYEATYLNDVNSYSSLPGGFGKLKQITGDTNTTFWASSASEEKWNTTDHDILKNALISGASAQLSSWDTAKDVATGETTLVSDHAFAIIGYNETTDNFILTNPWGANHTGGWLGTFEVSMDQMWQGGSGSTGIAIIDSNGASGAHGQLVTAMAAAAPASSATLGSQTIVASNNPTLLAATQAA